MVTTVNDVILVSINPMRDVLWLIPNFADGSRFPHNWNSDVDFEKNLELRAAIRRTLNYSFSELAIGEGAIKLLVNVGYFTHRRVENTVTMLLPLLEQELGRDLHPEYE